MNGRVLVTGATGFVGGAVVRALAREGVAVTAAARRDAEWPAGVRAERVAGIGPDTDWRAALAGCGAVVHLAARVHVMRDQAAEPSAAYRSVNTEGTLALARAAAAAGVRRFVYLSSIKVNGEVTRAGEPFTEASPVAPSDPYGVSKAAAEAGLLALASARFEPVIIRPPLVYGPGVKANFARMVRALERGLPLPLGGVTQNRRSLIGLDNLVDLIARCLTHPAAAGQVFLASDGEDLSTAGLLRRTAAALGVRARLVPVPAALLVAAAAAVGRGDDARRLVGNLQVDSGKARRVLDWRPPVGVDEGLRRAVAAAVPAA